MLKKMLQAVQEIARDGTAPLGFGFLDLQSGESCCIHGEQPFPTASVFKIFLLMEMYRQIEAGQLEETMRLKATPENAALGSGGLRRMRHGAELSLHDHAVLMMMISDNTSTDLLFDLVGKDNIRKNIIEPLGLENTRIELNCTEMLRHARLTKYHMGDFFLCKSQFQDSASPLDMLSLLQALHEERFLSHETTETIMDLMRPFPKYNRLEKYLPEDTKIHRKTGSLGRLANDAGIVYTDKGAYAIVVFYNGNLASREEYDREGKRLLAEELIARVSKAVYDIYMEN